MPTNKPRVMLTLKPEQYELLKRLSRVQGRSMAAAVMELLETVTPVLERVVVAVEAAERTQVMAREGLQAALERSEKAILPHVAAAMGQLDLLVDAAQGGITAPGKGARRAQKDAAVGGASAPPRSSRRVRDPRPVTRGSGRGVARGVDTLAGAIARRVEAGPVRRHK